MKTEKITRTTPLFNLWLDMAELQHGPRTYRNVRMYLTYRKGAPRQYDFPSLIADYNPQDEGIAYTKGYLNWDCFSEEEVEAIEAYLTRHPVDWGVLRKEPVTLPVPSCASVVEACEGYGSSGEWHPDREDERFDCPVTFTGLYNVDGADQIAGPPPPELPTVMFEMSAEEGAVKIERVDTW